MPDSGMGIPSFSIIWRNRSRSSARSIVSGDVPIIFTPSFASSLGDIERRLTAELDDDAIGLLLFINAQNIFHRQRFKIQLIRGVVIGGNRFRIAVDHDGFIALVAQGKGAWTQQ